MASSAKDDFYRLPNFAIGGVVPEYLRRPTWLPNGSMVLPNLPSAPWSLPPSFSPPGPSPFPDFPSFQPPQIREPHEVDPPEKNPYNDPEPNPRNNPAWDPNFLVTENPSGRAEESPSSGLPGLLRATMSSGETQPGVGYVSNLRGSPEFGPERSNGQQEGLLGRILSLHAEQNHYKPVWELGGQSSSAVQNPNVLPMPNASSPTEVPAPPSQPIQQYTADQAQLARAAAAARLARGVRSLARAEAAPPDPIDIAKSTGVGLVNGAINSAGLVAGDIPTGFGYFPSNPISDYFKSWRPDELRHTIERHTGEFYQPKTRSGRYAETIGEFVPAVLGGELYGVYRGAPSMATMLRELPWTLGKHAVAPGAAVQGLEEALPDSRAGELLQKSYPMGRRALPLVSATERYLASRIAPK